MGRNKQAEAAVCWGAASPRLANNAAHREEVTVWLCRGREG